MNKLKGRRTPLRRSLWVVLAYLVAGVAWITFSDALVERWFTDPRMLSQVQTYKGWGFVLVTALVLFIVLQRQLQRDRFRLELQHHQREEIRQLSQFQQNVIDNASIWINVLDPQSRVVLWNKAAEQISGYSEQEVAGKDDIWAWLYPDECYRREITATAAEILADARKVEGFETRIITRDGRERLMSWNSSCFYDDDGVLVGSIAIGMDVTERREAEKLLQQRERQITTLMDNLPGMAYRCLYDEFWTMKFASSGCRDLTGYAPEELVDNRNIAFADLLMEEDNGAIVTAVEEAMGSAESFALEYRLIRKDGRVVWVWARGRAVEYDGGLVLEGIILDVTDRKILEQELAELATHDTLTGLYNRREINRLLEEEVRRAARYHRRLAVLWIDLDYFKSVNDDYGHPAGDRVLNVVCQRLSDSIRSIDAIGRYGGEEFIVLLKEMDQPEAHDTAERLRRLIADNVISLNGRGELKLTVSIGVAVFPHQGLTAEALCEAADQAMYEAKKSGRNQVCIAAQSAGESL